MELVPDKHEQALMNDVREYMESLWERFPGEELRERAWEIQDRIDNDEEVTDEEALFADFYWDAFVDCNMMTPYDFRKIVEFASNPDLRIMYIDKGFGTDEVVIDFLQSILPSNCEIYLLQLFHKNLATLEPDETFICWCGDKFALEQEGGFLLNSYVIRKYHEDELLQFSVPRHKDIKTKDGKICSTEYIEWHDMKELKESVYT